jgi:hypothetical protein
MTPGTTKLVGLRGSNERRTSNSSMAGVGSGHPTHPRFESHCGRISTPQVDKIDDQAKYDKDKI